MLTLAVGLLLAYANGANDNFKGVATLFGTETASYRKALTWATGTTLLGSLAAVFLAQGLLAAFQGKGLVPASVVGDAAFSLAVAAAAGLTVLLATLTGFPISTTHALIGALVGAGWMASPHGVDTQELRQTFLLPLLLSPLLAVVAALVLYPILHRLRMALGVAEETCICVGNEEVALVPGRLGPEDVLARSVLPTIGIGESLQCRVRYRGALLGLSARRMLDNLHFLSAGAVSFARGVNDTPKIASMLLVAGALDPWVALVAVALTIAVGGIVSARRVASTMSHRVTNMNPGQGFTANLVTSLLVLGASRFGLPVSTTHVSCGSLFGIGAAGAGAKWAMIGQILAAWLMTLPLAGIAGAVLFQMLRSVV